MEVLAEILVHSLGSQCSISPYSSEGAYVAWYIGLVDSRVLEECSHTWAHAPLKLQIACQEIVSQVCPSSGDLVAFWTDPSSMFIPECLAR